MAQVIPVVQRLPLTNLRPQSPNTPVKAWQTGNPPPATPRHS
jgi:hypothetical protein